MDLLLLFVDVFVWIAEAVFVSTDYSSSNNPKTGKSKKSRPRGHYW